MNSIVFDIGGTYIRSAYARGRNELLHMTKNRTFPLLHQRNEEADWHIIIDAIAAYVTSIERVASESDPIVVSFPGPVDGGRILSAPKFVGSSTAIPDIKDMISQRTGRNVHLINDVSAAAWRFSGISPHDRFMVLTVSTGIGSKIFDRNNTRKVLDDVAYSGEIGHVVVDSSLDAPLCDCGGKGHLEVFSSGSSIERMGRERALIDPVGFAESACAKIYGATAETLTNEDHIVPAFLLGDTWSRDLIYNSIFPLARVIGTVAIACGLEQVIIIGGICSGGW